MISSGLDIPLTLSPGPKLSHGLNLEASSDVEVILEACLHSPVRSASSLPCLVLQRISGVAGDWLDISLSPCS